MDRDRIREIVRIAQESPIAELSVREGELEVRVVKRAAQPAAVPAALTSPDAGPTAPETSDTVIVRATKVGMFHRGKGPASIPLAREGDEVEPGRAVATLESLRKLTDVTVDAYGVIVRFLVEDGSAVEYGQPLIEVRLTKGGEDLGTP